MQPFFLVMTTTAYPQQQSGLTLVEVLTALTIIAILYVIALPQFRELHERWQVLQTAHHLESTLTLARSLAIQRSGNIGIQKNNNTPQGCQSASSNQEWGCGWFIYMDLNGNGTWNSNEPKLQEITLDGRINVIRTAGGANIKVDRFGMAGGLNTLGFTIASVDSDISSSTTHSLCMSSGGRIRIIQDSNCSKK